MRAALADDILRFLESHDDMAYTSVEIVTSLYPNLPVFPGSDANVARVEIALRSLISAELVEGRILESGAKEIHYFAISVHETKGDRLPYQI